jgi:competence protein CoiA
MLTAIRESDGQKVGAWEATKAERPFVCFCCLRAVTLKQGSVLAPHFAHRPPVTCEYGAGESEAHRRCKIAIYETLSADPRVTKCELERNLGTVRPDVSAYINRVPVAIEVQLSTLTLARIAYRTTEYRRKGIHVLWLPLYTRALDAELYAPRPWELWLHALGGGRVYYWLEGATVLPVHFRDYLIHVSGRTRDYQKLSRRKVPLTGPPLNLIEHFQPLERGATKSDYLNTPNAKIMVDTSPRWY